MSDLDDRIRKALAESEAHRAGLGQNEQSVLQMVGDAFRGRNRWLAVLAFSQILAFVALGILCAVRYFRAESTAGMIAWSSGFIVCVLTVALVKVWYWMEFAKNSVLREVKRLELQVATLSKRLEQVKPS